MEKHKVIKEFFDVEDGIKYAIGTVLIPTKFPEHISWLVKEGYIEEVKSEMIKSWEDLGKVRGYYLANGGADICVAIQLPTSPENSDVFATENLAISSRAKAKLSLLMADESVNGDWKPDWQNYDEAKYVIYWYAGRVRTAAPCSAASFLAFKTKEIRDEFLELHRELIETYFLQYQ